MLSSSSSSSCSGGNLVAHQLPRPSMIDRRWKPSVELAPNCPRCDSSNTKFCYYNNYSLTQPRYFCKGCRRYWTKGGSLRNVPVGGGCRKSRRGKLIRQAVADQSCARQSSSSSRHVSIRPDLMLDDPMGSGSQASMSTEASRSDGSGIDLADLYAKFSNKTSESGPVSTLTNCSLPVENIDFSGAASHDFQSNVANVGCSMLSLPGGGILSGDVLPLTEPDFDTNPISWSSQLLQLDEAVSNDLLWSSCPTMVSSSTWQPQPLQNNGFAPVPDEPSVLDTNLLDNNNWNMFDSATFEAQFF